MRIAIARKLEGSRKVERCSPYTTSFWLTNVQDPGVAKNLSRRKNKHSRIYDLRQLLEPRAVDRLDGLTWVFTVFAAVVRVVACDWVVHRQLPSSIAGALLRRSKTITRYQLCLSV